MSARLAGRLENKVVVVTGAGNGMARQVCLRLAAEGAKVVGCDIAADAAEETLRLVREAGGEMESLFPLDLRDESEAHGLMEYAAERYGGIDALYNNAMAMKMGSIESLPLDDWRETIDSTLTIHFLASKHAIPQIRARGGGSIVFVGSISGTHVGAGYSSNQGGPLFSYACAKAGIHRMASALANDLAADGIRVNTILPGNVETEVAIGFYGQPGEAARQISEGGNLIRRLGRPDDIANAAVFLLSDESEWVTGIQLPVDGGFIVSGGVGLPEAADRQVLDPVLEQIVTIDQGWQTTGVRRPRY